MAPLLALGFLVRPHQRTLAQAALQFARGLPGAAGVFLGGTPVERRAALFRDPDGLPFTRDEWHALGAGGPAGPGTVPPTDRRRGPPRTDRDGPE